MFCKKIKSDYNNREYLYQYSKKHMKAVYPKNIKKWLLAWLTFQIGPISLSIVQLFLLAIWVAASMGVFNSFSKSWSKAVGIFFAAIIFIIFVIIAFFKISELGLVAFIAKMIRNNFFDTTKKFQINYEKENKMEVILKEIKSHEEKKLIEQKESKYDQESLDRLEKWGLI